MTDEDRPAAPEQEIDDRLARPAAEVDVVGLAELPQEHKVPFTVAAEAVVVADDDGASDTDVVRVTVLPGGPLCAWRAGGCFPDYNAENGIDGDDVIAFFADWDANSDCADVDGSGGVDGDDVIVFVGAWDAGSC